MGLGSSLAALVALLATLGSSVGLGLVGWAAGLGCGLVIGAIVARGLTRSGAGLLGPADLVTLLRTTLACAVAALVGQSLVARPATAALVGIAATALLLDAVDGLVARRTGTASAFGARFDGEADAFLILVLSVHVAQSYGAWVLVLGVVRYVFGAAGGVLPWLRGRLPFRYWRKVVTAVLGITLTMAAADLGPHEVTQVGLVVALALVAESFGRDVLWLWRRRPAERPGVAGPADPVRQRA